MHELVIILAKYLIVIPVVAVIVLLVRLQTMAARKKFAAELLVGALLAVWLAKVGSKVFYDPRPFVAGHFTPYFYHANDNGFPSDHTLLSAFLAFAVWQYNRTLGLVLLAVAVAIGLARVIAGVHHLADIAGSICFAALGAWLGVILVDFLYRKLAARRTDPAS